MTTQGLNNNKVKITNSGTLILNPLTSAEMVALSPVAGERCYCSTFKKIFTYNGSVWLVKGETIELTNNCGSALVEGDVVIFNSAANESCTTTTTQGNKSVAGAVVIGGDNGAQVTIAYKGIWNVLNADAVARGNFLITSTTAKKSTDVGSGQTGIFAQALQSTGAAGLVPCFLFVKEVN